MPGKKNRGRPPKANFGDATPLHGRVVAERQILIRVSPALNQAAIRCVEACQQVVLDDVQVADPESAHLKYGSVTTGKKVMDALQRFAKHLAETNGKYLSVVVELKEEGAHSLVLVDVDLLVPPVFSDLCEDAAKTKLEAIKAGESVAKAAQLFVEAFPQQDLVRIELTSALEEPPLAEMIRCESWFTKLHQALLEFAVELIKAQTRPDAHSVTIVGTGLADLKIESDGKDIKLKGALLRALLTLALLRKEISFPVEQFATVYGLEKANSTPGKTFNNAIAGLKRIFPQLDAMKAGDQRSVPGIIFKSVPTDLVLKAMISRLPVRNTK